MSKMIFVVINIFLGFVSIYATEDLFIFGGENHDVFLGVLNGDQYSNNSIWNAYGDYGNKYSDKCIWNRYSDYGSSYSNYSPFSTWAEYPPVIVDRNGNFYGYFTIKEWTYNRAKFDLVNIIYKKFNVIRQNVTAAYKLLFSY